MTHRYASLNSYLLLLVLCLTSSGVSTHAQDFNSRQTQSYSVVAQFSPQKNPNGPWSYGYTASLGSPFVPFAIKGTTCCSNQIGWFGPFGPAPGYPLVLESSTGTGTALDIDPGPEGEYSVVRWTAPSGGTWDFVGDFYGTGATTVDVHILKNGASVYDNALNASEEDDFGLTMTVKAGDKIDFAVGYGGAFGNDPTGFKLDVSPHVYSFTAIDFPGANQTMPQGINDRGDIVGQYFDSTAVLRGFQLSNGVYTTINAPGSTVTAAYGINNSGEVAGLYLDDAGGFFGFRLNHGKFAQIAFVPGGEHTGALGINNQGVIVGGYDTGDQATDHGFILNHGIYIAFDDPVAAPASTTGAGINAKGEIVGYFADDGRINHGFLFDKGEYTTLDFPGADAGTFAFGINSKSQVVGQYVNGPSGTAGYVMFRGDYVSVIYPGTTTNTANGINNAGQVVGFYVDGSGKAHGFLASPKCEGMHALIN